MRAAGLLGVVAMLGSVLAAQAGPHDITPAFRDRAVQACTGDAIRLCAAYLMDEGQVARCMEANRRQLTPACRVVVDQGIRTYNR